MKATMGLLAIVLLIWSIMPVVYAQKLPTGNWVIDANGHSGTLNIINVDPRGNLDATLNGQKIYGFWNDASKEISFVEIVNTAYPDAIQIYTGYYWKVKEANRIAGWFKSFARAGGSAQKSLYGWTAEQKIV